LINLEKGKNLDDARNQMKHFYEDYVKHAPENMRLYTVFYDIVLALINLKEGKIGSARSQLKKIDVALSEMPQWEEAQLNRGYSLFRAELLYAEDSIQDAIAVMEGMKPLEIPHMNPPQLVSLNLPILQDILPRLYVEIGDLDSAINEYERLITFDPASTDRRWAHPLYFYRIAKLYEKKGWEGKAIEQYQKFLSLWKNADLGHPEVEDAKKRLAGLKGG
jgi:tetratricopeptide (TPR) repeat protein